MSRKSVSPSVSPSVSCGSSPDEEDEIVGKVASLTSMAPREHLVRPRSITTELASAEEEEMQRRRREGETEKEKLRGRERERDREREKRKGDVKRVPLLHLSQTRQPQNAGESSSSAGKHRKSPRHHSRSPRRSTRKRQLLESLCLDYRDRVRDHVSGQESGAPIAALKASPVPLGAGLNYQTVDEDSDEEEDEKNGHVEEERGRKRNGQSESEREGLVNSYESKGLLLRTIRDLHFTHEQERQQSSRETSDLINEEFQRVREIVTLFRCAESTYEASPWVSGAFHTLTDIAKDFTYAVETYGRIIVSEMNLPEEQRTIKVDTRFGGVAGGKKYFIAGILFKFAIDTHGLYGGDHFAAKAAKHEMNSLMAFSRAASSSADIGFPLMALLDLRGYRLIASSVVPINSSTLVYGSTDGGNTVVDKEPAFHDKFSRIARVLNLKGHRSSDPSLETLIYGPSDMEAHLGRDGRFYVLDLARLFPPEYIPELDPHGRPLRRLGQQLYSLLRPELVTGWPHPLSSDAFSTFGKIDRSEHNSEVREVTEHLHAARIPAFASYLDEAPLEMSRAYPGHFSLVRTLHNHGLNVRHLGAIWLRVVSPQWKAVIGLEIIARVTKNLMNSLLRDLMAHCGQRLVQQPFKLHLARFLAVALFVPDHNRLTEAHAKYQRFCLDVFLPAVFGQFPAISASSFPLSFNRRLLYLRLRDMTGLRLTADAVENRLGRPEALLYEHDVEDEPFQVRYLGLVDMANGFVAYERASKESINSEKYHTRSAIDHFTIAMIGNAHDPLLLWCMATSLVRAGSLMHSQLRAHNMFFLAAEYFALSRQHALSYPHMLLTDPNGDLGLASGALIDFADSQTSWKQVLAHQFDPAFTRSLFLMGSSFYITLGSGNVQLYLVDRQAKATQPAMKPRRFVSLYSKCNLNKIASFDATERHPRYPCVLLVATTSVIQVWAVNRRGSIKHQLCPPIAGPRATIRSIRILCISKADICFATLSGKSTLHTWKVAFNDESTPIFFTPDFAQELPETAFVNDSCLTVRFARDDVRDYVLLRLSNVVFLFELKKIYLSLLKLTGDHSFPAPLLTLPVPKNCDLRSVWFAGPKLIATGISDHTISLWQPGESQKLHPAALVGHAACVTALDGCVPSGLLASGDLEGVIRLWHIPTKICVRVFHQAPHPIESLTLCDGGSQSIICTTFSSQIQVWQSAGTSASGSSDCALRCNQQGIVSDDDEEDDHWETSLRNSLFDLIFPHLLSSSVSEATLTISRSTGSILSESDSTSSQPSRAGHHPHSRAAVWTNFFPVHDASRSASEVPEYPKKKADSMRDWLASRTNSKLAKEMLKTAVPKMRSHPETSFDP
ncbi:MAG: hypothetical protein Q8P67_01100 [archaeon]|nr:hypothetical protein [archaeon]